jgi:hypothetical protein
MKYIKLLMQKLFPEIFKMPKKRVKHQKLLVDNFMGISLPFLKAYYKHSFRAPLISKEGTTFAPIEDANRLRECLEKTFLVVWTDSLVQAFDDEQKIKEFMKSHHVKDFLSAHNKKLSKSLSLKIYREVIQHHIPEGRKIVMAEKYQEAYTDIINYCVIFILTTINENYMEK